MDTQPFIGVLERIALALEKIVSNQEQSASGGAEASKDAQEAVAKVATKQPDSKPESLASIAKDATMMGVVHNAKAGLGIAENMLSGLLNTRYAQEGIVKPADRIMGEVSQLSQAGHYLTDKEAESYGSSVAVEQAAMQANMKKLQPFINRGTMNNIQDFVEQKLLDLENEISTKGVWKTLWDGGVRQAPQINLPDYVRKQLQRNQGLDALGR